MIHKSLSIILALAFVMALPLAADAAKKKKKSSSSDYTAEQREKIREEGRAVCKKHYGATSRLYKVDYYRRRFVCSSDHS